MLRKITLKDALNILGKLGVDPSEIIIGKQGLKEITEIAKNIACKKLLEKK